MGANAWGRIRKELKIKLKFYVSSRDVRIGCPRFKIVTENGKIRTLCVRKHSERKISINS
jgi:hypothetical protein